MKKTGIRCPTCGAPGMRRVPRDITTRVGRRAVIVKAVEVEVREARLVERDRRRLDAAVRPW